MPHGSHKTVASILAGVLACLLVIIWFRSSRSSDPVIVRDVVTAQSSEPQSVRRASDRDARRTSGNDDDANAAGGGARVMTPTPPPAGVPGDGVATDAQPTPQTEFDYDDPNKPQHEIMRKYGMEGVLAFNRGEDPAKYAQAVAVAAAADPNSAEARQLANMSPEMQAIVRELMVSGGGSAGGNTNPTPTSAIATPTPTQPVVTATTTPVVSPTPFATATPSPEPTPSPSPSPTPEVGRVQMYLSPASASVQQGEVTTLDLYIDSPEKPVGGYTTIVLFNPLEVQIDQVREGTNSWLGFPMVARVNQNGGTIVLSTAQGSALDEPRGRIHLVSLDFVGAEPGVASISLSESEVANTDAQRMVLTSQRGARITVRPAPTPGTQPE